MNKRNLKDYTISDMYCVRCGNRGIDIPRRKGKARESGHLKKIYCLNCKDETNHVEIIGSYSYEDFIEEFKLGRFKDDVRVPIKDLIICSNELCEYNKNGRCWNADGSYNCGHRVMEGEK